MAATKWGNWTASTAHDDIPNVVKLELPSNHANDGSAWVYLPSKDTIFIGPPGSYHVDIAHSLKTLVDKKNDEKPITGVLYDDGYADYFDAASDSTSGRILSALKMYHDNHYEQGGFGSKSDTWDDSGGYYLYPTEDDYEDPDDADGDKGTGGLDTNTHGINYNDFDDQVWSGSGKSDDYKNMKPSPGASKPIGEWDVQDYLNWRDKKNWSSSGWNTTREDYPHFRWSYGDSQIMKGNPHDGLWVWPTQNGYPSHFDQTGPKGLGNCAQGRIYPHEGDRWEILTWPGRPRNAPSQAIREYIQKEAEEAVKKYVMEKIGVPEDKIFFTNMHYGAAVSSYDSPSYPGYTYPSSTTKYVSKPFHYDYVGLTDWNAIPEGSWHILKDPEGREWQLSSMPPQRAGDIRIYATDWKEPKTQELDPNTAPTVGWQIGTKVYDEDAKDEATTENPYDWQPGTGTDLNESILDTYNRLKNERRPEPVTLNKPGDQIGFPVNSKALDWHKNPDGTYSRIQLTKTKGNVEFIWDGTRYTMRELTPEETYGLKVRWFAEDQDLRNNVAQKLFPEAFGGEGVEYDENKDPIPPTITSVHKSIETGYPIITTNGPAGSNIHTVTPEEYDLAYRLHGDDWWKYLFPNQHNAWTEA